MAWYHRLRNTMRSEGLSGELDRELEFHLAERIDELVASGMTEEEARREARLRFGNPTVQKERARDRDVLPWLESLVADDGPIRELHVFDLRESMRNGGGPACLRLRVVLTEQERRATHAGLWIDDARYAALTDWVKRHYRDRLAVGDLADPALLDECRTALDDLTRLLGLGADLYPFQRNA